MRGTHNICTTNGRAYHLRGGGVGGSGADEEGGKSELHLDLIAFRSCPTEEKVSTKKDIVQGAKARRRNMPRVRKRPPRGANRHH